VSLSVNVSDQVRASAREKARKRMEEDIYRLCLTVGLDPDSIPFENGVILWQPDTDQANPFFNSEIVLRKLFDAYEKVI
jgi:hypothetical protein